MTAVIVYTLAEYFKHMIDKLTEDQIEELLRKQLIGRVGCHAEGVTYVVPISYAYADGYVYSHTREGMKVDLMRKNSAVCFEVDNTHDTSNWQSVIAWGTFEEISDATERINALTVLHSRVLPLVSTATAHLGSHWPFSHDELTDIDGIVFRICLKEKTGRFESNIETPSFTY